jgi:hypothetical protein
MEVCGPALDGGAVVAKALSGHVANPEVSVLPEDLILVRNKLILLGARVRVVEDSIRSVRRNASSAPRSESAVDHADDSADEPTSGA